MDGIEVRIRTWTRASDADIRTGLMGYLSLVCGPWILDGITVRRTADGRMTLSYPERRDGQGRRHPLIRPINDAARQAIEKMVFGAATVTEEIQS
jgi:DNA-binding cell septation regulator SpoVG